MAKLYRVYFMENGVKRYVQSGMDIAFSENRAHQIVRAMARWRKGRKCFIERVEDE